DAREDVGNNISSDLPPQWDYFAKVREILFGVPLDPSTESAEAMIKARDEYGLEGGSMVMRSNGMSLFLNVLPERSHEISDLRRKIERAMPDEAGFRSSQRFGGRGGGDRLRILLR